MTRFKMKRILSLLIISVLIGCTSKNRYHIDEITNPTDTLCFLKKDMSLVNGIVYNEFGDLGLFINGQRDGLHKIWYDNGQLKYEGNFINGKVDGLSRKWSEYGQLELEGNYKDGKLID